MIHEVRERGFRGLRQVFGGLVMGRAKGWNVLLHGPANRGKSLFNRVYFQNRCCSFFFRKIKLKIKPKIKLKIELNIELKTE